MCIKCNNDLCSCELPKGVRGRVGKQGPKGDSGVGVGIPGKSAYQTWLDNGHAGSESAFLNWLKGTNGSAGTNGLSAYQIWLAQPGNSGKTQVEFLDSLVGPEGTPPTISVGATTTLSPGQNATVTQTGTPPNAIVSFGIPRGDVGAQGNQGVQGIAGFPGANSLIYQKKASSVVGAVIINNNTLSSVTQIAINKTSMSGYTGTPLSTGNANDWLIGIVVGSRLQLSLISDPSIFGIYTVSAVTVTSTQITFTVINVVSNGVISANDVNISVSYIIPPIALPNQSTADGIPVGVSWDFWGKSAINVPEKWLLADGSIKQIGDYPELFACLGTTYGGNGTTTFGLPDTSKKVVGGIDGSNTIGSTKGADSFTIGNSNLPQHTHTATFAGTPLGTHSHTVETYNDGPGSPTKVYEGTGGTTHGSAPTSSISAGTPAGTVTVNNGGGVASPQSISLYQPTIFARKIIKALP